MDPRSLSAVDGFRENAPLGAFFAILGRLPDFPMIVFLYGKDPLRVVDRRSSIRDKFPKKYPGATVVTVEAGGKDGTAIAEAVLSAGADDLFSSKRLVDIRDACSMSEAAQDVVVSALKGVEDSSSLLFSETNTPTFSKNPLAAYLKKHSDLVDSFSLLSVAESEKFFRSELSRYPGKVAVSREALSSVVTAAKGDSAMLSTMAATLSAFRDEGEIVSDDVSLFLSPDPEEKAFQALDALLSGDRARAVSVLLREAGNDGTALRVMGLLAWQVRELFRVREAYDRGVRHADDIARATGMKPFVAGKLLARIDRFPLSRLRNTVSLLADLDARVKSGHIGNELALVLFVGKM